MTSEFLTHLISAFWTARLELTVNVSNLVRNTEFSVVDSQCIVSSEVAVEGVKYESFQF